MQHSLGEGEDIFFDSLDYVGLSSDSSSPPDSVLECMNTEFVKQIYEIWTDEMRSISERRALFLNRMELGVNASPQTYCLPEIVDISSHKPDEPLENERASENNRVASECFSSSNRWCDWDLDCCIRDLDSGKKFFVHEFGQDGLPSFLEESGSDRLITLHEFEKTLGLSHFVQQLMRREEFFSGVKYHDGTIPRKEMQPRKWLKGFALRNPLKSSNIPLPVRARVHLNGKQCIEFSAMYMGQEIQGHRGAILTMKFTPDGRFLATGGEDCIARIWSAIEIDNSCKCLPSNSCPILMNGSKGRKSTLSRKSLYSADIVIPKRIFKLVEKPIHEFCGHRGDILDLSWSNSNHLLTSSMDKTVRLWRIGSDECLRVFRHNNYVTCVQFNPKDHEHFISGSIDGKVRIWGIEGGHVVDWVEVQDIVTAVSYRPDGQGFVVGSIAGCCQFFEASGNNPKLERQLFIQGKKKRSSGKRITGFQFVLDNPQKLMVTSADSKVRIVDDFGVVLKFRGLRKSKYQLHASFTEDGRYIISVGNDSRIYIWNHNSYNISRSKGLKSVRACEHFVSDGAVIAVPWCGIDKALGHFGSGRLSLQMQKESEQSVLKDLDCFSKAGWLFADGRGSSLTWPEERLFSSHDSFPHRNNSHCIQDKFSKSLATWSQVIVAASGNGAIRTFQNYGLPVRL